MLRIYGVQPFGNCCLPAGLEAFKKSQVKHLREVGAVRWEGNYNDVVRDRVRSPVRVAIVQYKNVLPRVAKALNSAEKYSKTRVNNLPSIKAFPFFSSSKALGTPGSHNLPVHVRQVCVRPRAQKR